MADKIIMIIFHTGGENHEDVVLVEDKYFPPQCLRISGQLSWYYK